MELSHLISLIQELPANLECKYVRGDDTCRYLEVLPDEPRVKTLAPNGEKKDFAASYLAKMAERIKPLEMFNISQLMNNSGSMRPVLEAVIAHTKEFYWVKTDGKIFVVWIPDKPHKIGDLVEWTDMDLLTEPNINNNPEVIPKSNIIIYNDIDAEEYDAQKLGGILQTMYEAGISNKTQVANVHLFGIKYGLVIKRLGISNKQIFDYTTLNESYMAELSKGIKIAELINNQTAGMSFWKPNIQIVNQHRTFRTGILNKYLHYLSAIRTKPFLLLAGISGTGKSRIVRKLAQASTTEELEKKYTKDYADDDLEKNRWNLHKPANFEIIQVKPNWHNSMDVVGYESNIPNPHYVFTPFVEFIAKAWLNPEVPFFLCLDEMNLAPVEEYFAEFLSAIESRSKCNGKYETDPIIKPFNTFGEKVCEQMVKGLFPGYDIHNATPELLKIVNRFKEKGLTLPENLIVIGTVNMDETTFSFSRKVLDRAMSFEMNEVDYDGFLNDAADIITEPLSAEVSLLLVDRIVDAREVKAEIDAEVVMSYLKAVNKTLDNTPFKLGYRAANEALLYVAASRSFGQESLATALDEFTTMKILSRIEGDTTKLRVDENSDRTILDELKAVIEKYLKEKGASEEGHTGESAEVDGGQQKAEPIKWKSLEKLERMRQQLKRNSFVSYWE